MEGMIPVAPPSLDPRWQLRSLSTRRLTASEIEEVVSGSGWSGVRQGLPSGEANGDLQPLYWRGLFPRAGIADEMVRKSVGVAAGVEKRCLTIASLGFEVLPPVGATAAELEQTRWVREDCWGRLEGGLLDSAIVRPLSSEIHGFSVSEIVMEPDKEDAQRRWRLSGLHWMHPSTIKYWVLDRNGFATAAVLYSEMGTTTVSWDKLFHVASGFYGRNYEGISALRSLRYPVQHWSQTMVNDAIGRERGSSGILLGIPPLGRDRASNRDEFDLVDSILANIVSGEEPTAVLPEGWVIKAEYLNAVPDSTAMLGYLDHLCAWRLTDTVSELGASSQLGSRALASEQRADKQTQLDGLVSLLVHRINDQIHRPLYLRNGWNPRRMCRIAATKLQSSDKLRRLLEFLTTPVPSAGSAAPLQTSPEIQDQIKRWFDLER